MIDKVVSDTFQQISKVNRPTPHSSPEAYFIYEKSVKGILRNMIAKINEENQKKMLTSNTVLIEC